MQSHVHNNAPIRGTQINDLHCKLLICEESENDTFYDTNNIKLEL